MVKKNCSSTGIICLITILLLLFATVRIVSPFNTSKHCSKPSVLYAVYCHSLCALCQLIFSHLFAIQQFNQPACPQSQAGDAEGTEQSFIADPIPV